MNEELKVQPIVLDMYKWNDFKKELAILINKYSYENGSDTPDFIVADYLAGCLEIYNATLNKRDKWWGFHPWDK